MAELVTPAVFKNGSKSVRVRALLDTGAEKTLLSSEYAQKIGIKKLYTFAMRGAGGRAVMSYGMVDSIEIPSTICQSGRMGVVVFDERAFPMGGLTGLGAIIGLDFMKKARMEIAAFTRTRMVRCVAQGAQGLGNVPFVSPRISRVQQLKSDAEQALNENKLLDAVASIMASKDMAFQAVTKPVSNKELEVAHALLLGPLTAMINRISKFRIHTIRELNFKSQRQLLDKDFDGAMKTILEASLLTRSAINEPLTVEERATAQQFFNVMIRNTAERVAGVIRTKKIEEMTRMARELEKTGLTRDLDKASIIYSAIDRMKRGHYETEKETGEKTYVTDPIFKLPPGFQGLLLPTFADSL